MHVRLGKINLLSPALLSGLFLSSNEKKELEIAKKKLANEDPLILLLKHAKLSEKKQNLDDAINYYHEALVLLQKYEDEKTWNEEKILNAKIYIYDNLANAAMVQQNYDNAEKLFKEVMRGLLQKGISSTDNSVIEISLKLAMMFAVREMVDEAEKGYEYCIRSQEEKLQNETNPDDNTLALFGLALDSYARFLTLQKRYKEARKFLQRALDTAVRVLGADSPQVGVLHSDIATLDLLQGDDDSALANLNTAIQLAKKSNSPDLAAFYVNLGNVYLNKSNLKSANDSCQAALALAQKLNMLSVIEEAKACLKTVKEYKKT